MLCHVNQSHGEAQDGKTIFHLEDVEIPPTPSNISHTLGELDPREKEIEKKGGPVEELKSIKLDDQHPERAVQIGPNYLEASGTISSTSLKSTKTYLPGPTRTCLESTH